MGIETVYIMFLSQFISISETKMENLDKINIISFMLRGRFDNIKELFFEWEEKEQFNINFNTDYCSIAY